MKRNNIIKLFCVEHSCIDGRSTFEVFKTLAKAQSFAYTAKNWNNENMPLYIFSSDFSADCIYEEDGKLNYEDCYELWQGNYEFIEDVKNHNYFEIR